MNVYFLLGLLISLSVNGQTQLLEKQAFPVGFRVIQQYDTTRSFDTTRTDSLRFRPVKIDLFYPATAQTTKAPLPYSYFLNLYGWRIDFRTSIDSCRKTGYELAHYYSKGLGLDSSVSLLRLPTRSYEAVLPATGSFPLVIYCPGYNGMSYENLVLLETLAARGYWVAAVSSVGKYPGYMTMDPVDVNEQVADARFALRHLSKTLPVMGDQVSVVGYSWGGLAASIVGMQEPGVQAVVSLDGSERYTYGDNQADDEQFNRIRQASYFRPHALTAPYLYLSSGREKPDFTVDSVYVLAAVSAATVKQYIRLPNTQHEDFSCLPYLASQVGSTNQQSLTSYRLIEQLVTSWLESYLKKRSAFSGTLQRLLSERADQITVSPPVLNHDDRLSTFALQGTIVDQEDKPLSYVNIGILGGSQGTVSQEDGSFQWQSSGANRSDTVRLSRVGYQSQDFPVTQLVSTVKTKPLRFQLQPQNKILPEVVVKTDRPTRRTLGNATESKFFSVGFGSDQLGAQVGIRINARKEPMYIEKVDFHVSYNRYDSLTIRLNIYRLANNVPTDNLMSQNVVVRLGKQTGRITFDLHNQPVQVSDDVLVALELLNGKGGPDQGIFLSAGMLNGSTYYRRASQGFWRRSKGVGVGMQVLVQY